MQRPSRLVSTRPAASSTSRCCEIARAAASLIPRTFGAPLTPLTPFLGIGFSIWLITELQWRTWARFATWFVIGAVIYAAYGYRHSKLGQGQVVQTKDT